MHNITTRLFPYYEIYNKLSETNLYGDRVILKLIFTLVSK
ncbi:protein of unknown function [Clostridium beijerinckii]|nr:protein of unknown function [Clostridium beijerinckii]